MIGKGKRKGRRVWRGKRGDHFRLRTLIFERGRDTVSIEVTADIVVVVKRLPLPSLPSSFFEDPSLNLRSKETHTMLKCTESRPSIDYSISSLTVTVERILHVPRLNQVEVEGWKERREKRSESSPRRVHRNKKNREKGICLVCYLLNRSERERCRLLRTFPPPRSFRVVKLK